ncbi:hypothetical protein NIES3974_02790 [Calothrix sp. NIES-3974]|nr:hypothetical protein NIES3974_02790 [Calothrix sp. NIES-3974]
MADNQFKIRYLYCQDTESQVITLVAFISYEI